MNTTSINKNFIDSRLASALVWQTHHRRGIRFENIPQIIRISQGGGEKMREHRLGAVLRYCETRQIMKEG